MDGMKTMCVERNLLLLHDFFLLFFWFCLLSFKFVQDDDGDTMNVQMGRESWNKM